MGRIVLTCSRPGIRRNGITHPASATYEEGEWSDDELAAFRADPAFSIVEIGDEVDLAIETDELVTRHAAEIERYQARVAALEQQLAEATRAETGKPKK